MYLVPFRGRCCTRHLDRRVSYPLVQPSDEVFGKDRAYPSAAIRSEIVEVHGGRSMTVTSYRRAVSKELG